MRWYQTAYRISSRGEPPTPTCSVTRGEWGRPPAHQALPCEARPESSCAGRVKFGAFYQFLEREHSGLFDRVATGHYARLIRPCGKGAVQMGLTPDAVKDQTYFLAHLTQEQLAQAMFPLGALTKARRSRTASGVPVLPPTEPL